MDPVTIILSILSVAERAAEVASDLARKNEFTAEQKSTIESRLQRSRDRLQAIYDRANEPADPTP